MLTLAIGPVTSFGRRRNHHFFVGNPGAIAQIGPMTITRTVGDHTKGIQFFKIVIGYKTRFYPREGLLHILLNFSPRQRTFPQLHLIEPTAKIIAPRNAA